MRCIKYNEKNKKREKQKNTREKNFVCRIFFVQLNLSKYDDGRSLFELLSTQQALLIILSSVKIGTNADCCLFDLVQHAAANQTEPHTKSHANIVSYSKYILQLSLREAKGRANENNEEEENEKKIQMNIIMTFWHCLSIVNSCECSHCLILVSKLQKGRENRNPIQENRKNCVTTETGRCFCILVECSLLLSQ